MIKLSFLTRIHKVKRDLNVQNWFIKFITKLRLDLVASLWRLPGKYEFKSIPEHNGWFFYPVAKGINQKKRQWSVWWVIFIELRWKFVNKPGQQWDPEVAGGRERTWGADKGCEAVYWTDFRGFGCGEARFPGCKSTGKIRTALYAIPGSSPWPNQWCWTLWDYPGSHTDVHGHPWRDAVAVQESFKSRRDVGGISGTADGEECLEADIFPLSWSGGCAEGGHGLWRYSARREREDHRWTFVC